MFNYLHLLAKSSISRISTFNIRHEQPCKLRTKQHFISCKFSYVLIHLFVSIYFTSTESLLSDSLAATVMCFIKKSVTVSYNSETYLLSNLFSTRLRLHNGNFRVD